MSRHMAAAQAIHDELTRAGVPCRMDMANDGEPQVENDDEAEGPGFYILFGPDGSVEISCFSEGTAIQDRDEVHISHEGLLASSAVLCDIVAWYGGCGR